MSGSKLRLDNQSDVLKGFDWGPTNSWLKTELTKEFTNYKGGQYQVDFKVEEGDIVFDFGASIGPFIWQIQNQKPSKVIAIEPSESLINALINNCQKTNLNCEIYKVGVGSKKGEEKLYIFKSDGEADYLSSPTLSFMDIVKEAKVDRIDFLKTDCEGGEYNIFNSQNFWWIKDNVKKIVGEWHLQNEDEKEKFKIFRDTYLRLYPKFKIYSIDMFDITHNLWKDMFMDYYRQIIVYIDNR